MKRKSTRWLRDLALAMACIIALPAFAFAAEGPPDLAGAWAWQPRAYVPPEGLAPATRREAGYLRSVLPLFRPEVAERLQARLSAIDARRSVTGAEQAAATVAGGLLGFGCGRPTFNGAMGYQMVPPALLPAAFEILASPGRLTLLDAGGLVRRVYLRDTPPPDALDESPSGTSIARWDGRTLHVRTTGLDPRNLLIIPGTELGRGAQVEEKISLVAADELQIVTTVTAPELYKAPVTSTSRYRRVVDRTFVEVADCPNGDDRAIDPTGAEHFDMTPPADLPPPPP